MWLYKDLNSFEGIEKIYNAIEPLRGKRKEWDIRPLGNRKNWCERIIKIDDNTYVLSDGWWASQHGNPALDEDDKERVLEDAKITVPIRWERREDGDYIQIRNNLNNSPSVSRYRFLDKYLPGSLRHQYDQSGTHWILREGKHKHLLPKGTLKRDYDNTKREWTKNKIVDRALEFKHVGLNQFELTHGDYKKISPIVHKETAKEFKKAIRELWDYARAVLPVYGYTLEEQYPEKRRLMGYWVNTIEANTIRNILLVPEEFAEKRLALCVMVAMEIGAYEHRYVVEKQGNYQWNKPAGTMFKEDERSWDRFRSMIYRAGGMMTTKEVDFY